LNSFQENAPGVLDGIKVFCLASPLWHASSVARMAVARQEAETSNRPTTRTSAPKDDNQDVTRTSARIRALTAFVSRR
jgi:hypothetical protein